MSGFRGAGRLLFNILEDDGSYLGYKDIDNLAELSIGVEGSNTTTLKATTDGTGGKPSYGAVIGTATEPGDDVGTIRFNEPNRNNLRLAFLGNDSDVSVTGAAVTDESITALLDAWVPLAHFNLDDTVSVVVTTDPAGTTYVEDTDYEVDYVNGMIKCLSTGAISQDEALLVDYTYQSSSGYKITARARNSVTAKILFVGVNLETNERIRLTANRVELTPNQQGNFISVDNAFLEYGLAATFKVPDGGSNPYDIQVYN